MQQFAPRLALGALLVLPALQSLGESYPDKPVRMIIASAPGGGSDTLGRIAAQGLSEGWQRPVVVDNRPGGGGSIATDIAVKSMPDGYTLLMQSFGISYTSALRRNLPFDVTRDVAPIVPIGQQTSMLVVHSSVPVGSVAEFIKLAKSKPGELNYGTSGAGGASHLAAELFASAARIRIVPVNYKGTGPALTALIAGELQLALTGISTALPHARSGRVKALGVTSTTRSPMMPEVPPIAETLPGFGFSAWYGLFAPAGIPRTIRQSVNTAVNRVLQQPAARKRIETIGAEPMGGTVEEFEKFFRSEIVRWHKVIREAGIRAD